MIDVLHNRCYLSFMPFLIQRGRARDQTYHRSNLFRGKYTYILRNLDGLIWEFDTERHLSTAPERPLTRDETNFLLIPGIILYIAVMSFMIKVTQFSVLQCVHAQQSIHSVKAHSLKGITLCLCLALPFLASHSSANEGKGSIL
jgi:hypothetical protein